MAAHSVSPDRESAAPSADTINQAGKSELDYDLRPYLQAAQQELESTLLGYRQTLPDSLIWMGKFALSGHFKLFSLPLAMENAITSTVAPWPLYVLLSCKAALGSENRQAWRREQHR